MQNQYFEMTCQPDEKIHSFLKNFEERRARISETKLTEFLNLLFSSSRKNLRNIVEIYPQLIFSVFQEFSAKGGYDLEAFRNGISVLSETLEEYFYPRNTFEGKKFAINCYFSMINQVIFLILF